MSSEEPSKLLQRGSRSVQIANAFWMQKTRPQAANDEKSIVILHQMHPLLIYATVEKPEIWANAHETRESL